MKLKYVGNFLKDEVWINAILSRQDQIKKLNAIWRFPNTLPGGILKIQFYVYKKKPSWITVVGSQQRLEFRYDLFRELKDSENDHYTLKFDIEPTTTLDRFVRIPVPFDCTTKKNIIKYLLDHLVK